MKKLLLGNEALAQGAIDSGLSGVYAYPGTPSTEITEYIQKTKESKEFGIHTNGSCFGNVLHWQTVHGCHETRRP